MSDFEEFWNLVNPGRKEPRPLVEPKTLHPNSPVPVRNIPDYDLIAMGIHVGALELSLSSATTTLSREEILQSKAYVCLFIALVLIGEHRSRAELEEQATELMHLPIRNLINTSRRVVR